MALQKISWPRHPFFNQLARPSRTKTDPTSQKHEYLFKSSIASSPSLLRVRRFDTPSAHPRDPGGGGFLASDGQRKERLAADAPPQAVALVYPRRCSLAGRCVTCCAIPLSPCLKNENAPLPQYIIGSKCFFLAKSNQNWIKLNFSLLAFFFSSLLTST